MGKQERLEMEMLLFNPHHHRRHHHHHDHHDDAIQAYVFNDDDDDDGAKAHGNANPMHHHHHHRHGNGRAFSSPSPFNGPQIGISMQSQRSSSSSSSQRSPGSGGDGAAMEEFGLLDKLIDWNLNGEVGGAKKIESLRVFGDCGTDLGVKTSGDGDFDGFYWGSCPSKFDVDKKPFSVGESRDFEEAELGFGGYGADSMMNRRVPPLVSKAIFDSSNLHYVFPVFDKMSGALADDFRVLSGNGVENFGVRGGMLLCGKGSAVKIEKQKAAENLMSAEGYIYSMAKDQNGCRFLQRKFDEGKNMVDVIFNGVIDHVVELMMHPFGNYLMQKLLEVCREEQKMEILLVLTEQLTDLVNISLNIHGTRAVQKLIDTLKTKQQRALVISALRPGILELIKDLNGNHVVQRCLEAFTVAENKFIFDAAAKHCVEIATHRHGCCVLQRCIDYSSGEYKTKMVTEICANAFELARDPFGNYVVQYILKLKNLLALASLPSQFEGKYVQLSVQKFSSNVIEKCLKFFAEDDRATIISEFLSVPHFDQLLQDPYGNYVIQSALHNCKGVLRAALIEAIRPHAATLRTSPYCKRIFSRGLMKKPCGC